MDPMEACGTYQESVAPLEAGELVALVIASQRQTQSEMAALVYSGTLLVRTTVEAAAVQAAHLAVGIKSQALAALGEVAGVLPT